MNKKILTSFMVVAALLTGTPVRAFARGSSVILAMSIDTNCVRRAVDQRGAATDQAYQNFREATEKAKTDRKFALEKAGKDRVKKKKAESMYRQDLAKASKDLSTARKNIAAKLKAQISLCKR